MITTALRKQLTLAQETYWLAKCRPTTSSKVESGEDLIIIELGNTQGQTPIVTVKTNFIRPEHSPPIEQENNVNSEILNAMNGQED